jgi:hypothetical protein
VAWGVADPNTIDRAGLYRQCHARKLGDAGVFDLGDQPSDALVIAAGD